MSRVVLDAIVLNRIDLLPKEDRAYYWDKSRLDVEVKDEKPKKIDFNKSVAGLRPLSVRDKLEAIYMGLKIPEDGEGLVEVRKDETSQISRKAKVKGKQIRAMKTIVLSSVAPDDEYTAVMGTVFAQMLNSYALGKEDVQWETPENFKESQKAIFKIVTKFVDSKKIGGRYGL